MSPRCCRVLALATLVFVRPTLSLAQNMMLRSYPAVTSAAINRGDFNNDGVPDLVFCSSGIGVALANPDGSLRAPIYSGTSPCQSLTVADFNNDGKLDVAIGSLSGTTQIYLGNGDGTFRLATTLPIQAQDLIAGDFNNDGKMDLAIANLIQVNTITIYPGLGNGSFGPPVTVGTQSADLRTLRIGDFDGDGKTDLAVSGFTTGGDNQVEVLFNNGHFAFTDKVVATNGSFLLTTADINQDGYTDLLIGQNTNCVPNPKSQTCNSFFKTLLSAGRARSFAITFTGTVGISSNFGMIDATVADVNGDGINDIVGLELDPSQIYAVAIWNGHPDGTFDTSPTLYELGGSVSAISIVALDANRDGRPDFAVLNVGDFDVGLSMLLNAVPRAPCATYKATSAVTGCQPTSNTYEPPNVRFVANGFDTLFPVTAMQLYVDNSLKFTVGGSHLNTSLTLGAGNHTIAFKAWDSAGRSHLSLHSNTVYNSAPGSVCSTPLNTARICIPAGATSTAPVLIFAAGYTPNTPTGLQLYVDGNLVFSSANLQNYISGLVSMTPGSHFIVFKVFDANGHIVVASKAINVS